jgi:hypothetical protein
MDDPWKIVDAIIWASIHPVREMPVGWKAEGAVLSHQFMPGLTDYFAANIAHNSLIRNAPSAPNSQGNLFVPMQAGTGVEGAAQHGE